MKKDSGKIVLSECCFDEAEISFGPFYTIATGKKKECAHSHFLDMSDGRILK